MPEVRVHSAGQIRMIHCEKGLSLLDVIRQNNLDIYSPCGGNGTCGKCKVYISGLGDVTSCLHKIEKDIEIILPGRKELNILSSQYEYSVKLPLDPGKEIDQSACPFGIAIDLGTTTLVFYLTDLLKGSIMQVRSVINPQTKYGGDVISRINYCLMNHNGLNLLQNEVIRVINSMIQQFTEVQSITSDDIVKITITGNTTMLHLLLGINPSSLAYAPFTPVFTSAVTVMAEELGIRCNKEAKVHIMPSLSAYIGADILAGLSTIQPSESVRNYLFLDIGTNGEMALITPEKIYFCSTAAGPAFEGANISCGMGGVEGAISEYDSEGYKTIGDTTPGGICGSGLIDIIAFLLDKCKIDTDGYMDDEFEIVPASDSSTGRPVTLKPSDVREVQLAKAAIAAGINLLLNKAGLTSTDTDALFLAGGFGNYLNTESAVRIGLIPAELRNKIIPVGNASGTGAVTALRSVSFLNMIERILQNAEYIELSEIDSFTEEFALNMKFPEKC